MRMNWRIVAAAVALGLVGAVTTSSAQDVTLGYRWTMGEQTRIRVTQRSSTTIAGTATSGGPGDQRVEWSMTGVFRTIVEDVAADGIATLRQVIESLRMEL